MATRVSQAGQRLDPAIFDLPVGDLRAGFYTDTYFDRARQILDRDGRHARVLMQVFNKRDAMLCGIDEAIAILKLASGRPGSGGAWDEGWSKLDVRALRDGDRIGPYEVVLTIEGDYALFAHLETDYLGVLGRRTRVATNTSAAVAAANGKDVLFFSARFDHPRMQPGDGYAAQIAGAAGVSTDAQASWWGGKGIGTIPHALIAAYDGDTVLATVKFAEFMDPSVNVIALVDFDNDCVSTSLAVARKLGRRLWGVRLDNSEMVVDKSLWESMGTFAPTGVNPELVFNVRKGLDDAAFDWVKIVVSGGFNAEKIARFEAVEAPVDAYAVGSAFFHGVYDFTADVAMVEREGKMVACHKVGRPPRPNPRLERVM